MAARRPAATSLSYEAGATLEQVRAWVVTAYPAARAHAAPTVAFALKTAPCGPGTSTIKLDESNRLVTVAEAGLVLLHLYLLKINFPPSTCEL